MNYRLYLLFGLVLLAGCSHGKKAADDDVGSISVHKIWRFDSVKLVPAKTLPYIAKNQLDLTGKDTLKFSYQTKRENKDMTAYTYKIMHDTVYVNGNPAYKILKLTAGELDLLNIFKNASANAAPVTDSVIMIYKAK